MQEVKLTNTKLVTDCPVVKTGSTKVLPTPKQGVSKQESVEFGNTARDVLLKIDLDNQIEDVRKELHQTTEIVVNTLNDYTETISNMQETVDRNEVLVDEFSRRVEEVATTVEGFDETLDQINVHIDGLEGQILDMHDEVLTMENTISGFRRDLTIMQNNIDAAIVEVEDKMIEVDGTLIGFDRRLTAADNNIVAINIDLASVHADITRIDGDISSINGKINTINQNITSIEGDIIDINGDIADINQDIIDLDNSKQDNLISGVNIKTIDNESILGPGNIELAKMNPTIPSGATVEQLVAIEDNGNYYALDTATREVDDGAMTIFTFEDEAEITYSEPVDNNCTLIIPNSITQGFISLLTISNMPARKVIAVQKESSAIPYNIRIVAGNSWMPGTSYMTAIGGKKIIFARCDGVDVEILIIEEMEE